MSPKTKVGPLKQDSLDFLRSVIESPSPSGFESPVRKLMAERMETYCDEVRHDVLGNVIGVLNPGAPKRVMLAGHCDEIGMMITNITDDGYLYFRAVGGFEVSVLVAQRVSVHTAKGDVPGVVGRKSVHLFGMEGNDPNKMPKMHDLWIDIGAKDKKDAEKAVAVGDYVTIDAGFQSLRNDLVVGRGFDDRAGAFVVAETMRMLVESKSKLKVAVYGVATTQEELGMRGAVVSAHGIDPHAGIAIDLGFASDYPTVNKNLVGDFAMNKGPIIAKGPNVNPVLGQKLIDTARKLKVPHQIEGAPKATGTDANVMQMTRAGVAAALVSVPNRYMHTPIEIISLKDLAHTCKLIAGTVGGLKGTEDFTPAM